MITDREFMLSSSGGGGGPAAGQRSKRYEYLATEEAAMYVFQDHALDLLRAEGIDDVLVRDASLAVADLKSRSKSRRDAEIVQTYDDLLNPGNFADRIGKYFASCGNERRWPHSIFASTEQTPSGEFSGCRAVREFVIAEISHAWWGRFADVAEQIIPDQMVLGAVVQALDQSDRYAEASTPASTGPDPRVVLPWLDRATRYQLGEMARLIVVAALRELVESQR